MPTSFKRREPRAAVDARVSGVEDHGVAPNKRSFGLRPSPFPSPVPLFSSGLASFDDLICGHGIPSSSLVTLCPTVDIASGSELGSLEGRADESKPRKSVRSQASLQHRRVLMTSLHAAEEAINDVLSYGVAQGLLADHDTLIVGRNVETFVRDRVPAYAVRQAHDTSQLAEQAGDRTEPTEDDEMRIAFRYAHRPKFQTTVAEPEEIRNGEQGIPLEHRFRAPLDLSKRWTCAELEEKKAAYQKGQGGLCLIDSTTYSDAWHIVEEEARRNGAGRNPLRIHLVSLGDDTWSKATNESTESRIVHLTRFLVRLRALLKRTALHKDEQRRRPVICTASISSHLLRPPWRAVVTQHLLRVVDIAVLLSDFSADQHLRRAYTGYAGSVCLLKGPSIGSLLPPGETRSILRGGTSEAGAENDIGWRRKKRGRGIVLETLHEDVDAHHVDEEQTQKGQKKHGDDIEDSATGLPRRRETASERAQEHRHGSATKRSDDEGAQVIIEQGGAEMTEMTPRPTRVTRFEGLKSLRERGLQAAAATK